jgi:hypothetical protein
MSRKPQAKKRKPAAKPRVRLDAVTLEVIRNALPAVANEMAADLQRTSYNKASSFPRTSAASRTSSPTSASSSSTA